MAFGPLPEQQAASGAWIGDDTCTVKVCFNETPFIVEFNLKSSGDTLLFGADANIGFGSTKQKQPVGKAE